MPTAKVLEASNAAQAPQASRTICQVLHALIFGGAEVLAARLARQLQDRYRFVFACLDELGALGEQLRDEGFRVEVIGRRAGVDWRCTHRLARFFRRERVDLVQAHQYTPFFYALLARGMRRRLPIMFTEHGRHFPDYPRRKRMIFNRLLLRQRDRVVGVGEAVRQAVIINEGIPPDRVRLIYNGVDLQPFMQGLADRDAVRREMGVEPGDFVLIQVARLDYLKDHLTAVRTIERVRQQCPRARLVLVGEGPERAKIEQEIASRNLAAAVRLLGLRKDVARLVPAADAFLLTSISEGIPLTLIEAMAARLPIVATRVGGIGEVVEEDATGLLAPSGEDAALARQVLRLANDPELARRMGSRGRERAMAMFSEAQMHAGYQKLFEEMLGE